MGPMIMKAWQAGADIILTAGLVKAGLFVAVLWVAIRMLPGRLAEARARLWLFGVAALAVLPALSWGYAPLWDLQVVEFPRSLYRESTAASPAFWLFLVWAVGATVLLGRFAMHWTRVARMISTAEPALGPRLGRLLEEARRRLGVRRPVGMAFTTRAVSPLVVGWRRPVILLAPEAAEWPEDRMLMVLCHELAHVRRGDYPAMLLGEVVRALYWINPLVFLGLREARMEQDRACDAAVLEAGFPSASYARHLVELARRVRDGSMAPAALTFGRRSDLRERVRLLMDRGARPMGGRRDRILATVTSAAVVALAVGTLAATNFWHCTNGV